MRWGNIAYFFIRRCNIIKTSEFENDYSWSDRKPDFSFYRIPKFLFYVESYIDLSSTAKMLYGVLLDRVSLSAVNDFRDEKGRVFVYYTIKHLCELFRCGREKMGKHLKELENKHMIFRRKQGQGKPDMIFVRQLPEMYAGKSDFGVKGKQISENTKTELPEVRKSGSNNTEYNNTENSYTDLSIIDYDEKEMERQIKEQINYKQLCKDNDSVRVDEILKIIIEILSVQSPVIRIGGTDYPTRLVHRWFYQIDSDHVNFVIDNMNEKRIKVHNMKSYLITALFNAVSTINHVYWDEIRGIHE